MSDAFAFELQRVTKRFGRKDAVCELSLRAPRGAKIGLLGVNGAGKTTTIRMLMGLTRPTSGSVQTLGRDPMANGAECRRQTGYVPETHLIYRWMCVGEVAGFCRRFYPTWNDVRCAELFTRFGLQSDVRVGALSKGTLAKLSLTLALAHDPQLLILDEPTSGLDPIVREDLLEGVLANACDDDRTILFSSHILADVERLAEHIVILHEGRVLASGPTDELLQRTKRIRAVLTNGARPAAAPGGVIWQCVEGREWLLTVRDYSLATIERLRADQAVSSADVYDLSLEEIFKDYVRGQAVSS